MAILDRLKVLSQFLEIHLGQSWPCLDRIPLETESKHSYSYSVSERASKQGTEQGSEYIASLFFYVAHYGILTFS